MKLIAQSTLPHLTRKDTIAVFLCEDFPKNGNAIPEPLSFIKEKANLSFFKGKPGETLFIPFGEHPAVIVSGAGKKDDLTKETLRNSAAAVSEICRKKKISAIHAIVPEYENISPEETARALGEGIYLSNYVFNRYKSKNDDQVNPLERAILSTPAAGKISKMLEEIEIVGENTLLCRDLINEISDVTNPVAVAKEAKKLAKLRGVTCTVYGKKEIEKMKMGLLLAVSRGSIYPPQLVVLKYAGNPSSKKSVAIIGKGITFDSGGINLKPSGHIEDMRSDMSGAAACLYTIKAAAELKLKKNIYAVLPLCENMVGKTAYRPGDVHIAYNGTSVEIGNTDAEGRLILADALAFAEDRLKPSYMIDIATLTGACLVCFGEIIAGLLTESDEIAGALFNAGETTGDRLWRLPMYREYADDIKSDIADINNVSSGRNAGTIMGATFLKNFVKKTPWAHIDIAGTSWYSKQRGYRPKYATGFGVRLFIEAIKNITE